MLFILYISSSPPFFFFFFNDTATTEIYTLSLHDALPISVDRFVIVSIFIPKLRLILILNSFLGSSDSLVFSELKMLTRSEERFSRNAETDIVCRLLLEKKKLQYHSNTR